MKLLVIDNYDSFTYNLVQLFGEMDVDLVVKRNDEISIDEIKNFSRIEFAFHRGRAARKMPVLALS